MSLSEEYNRHGFLSRFNLEQVNICCDWAARLKWRPCFFANDTMIVAQVFLEAMEGCLLFLSPLFVMQTVIFSPSAVVQAFVSSGFKDRLPSPVSESLRDLARRLVSTPSGGLSLWRFNAARSRRCSFSWLVSRDHLAAARSRMALKRCPWNFRWTL